MSRHMELLSKADKEKMAELTEDKALGEVASEKIFEDDPELARELAEREALPSSGANITLQE